MSLGIQTLVIHDFSLGLLCCQVGNAYNQSYHKTTKYLESGFDLEVINMTNII